MQKIQYHQRTVLRRKSVMRKKFMILGLVSVLTVSLLLVSCGKDPIVGKWKLESYTATLYGTTITRDKYPNIEDTIKIEFKSDGTAK